MTENQEQAEWGVEILLKRPDFADFFDHLREANFFSPENNSGPIPAEDSGYVRIPYWSALDYLEAVAKQSGANNDTQLAQKVMDVIRSVSDYRDPDGKSHDNYHTYRKFAEILGHIPNAAITIDDLRLIPIWLSSKYERGMVGHALDRGALRHLLDSNNPDDWQKAIKILSHCTVILWVEEEGLGKGRKKPISVVDDYWMNELIKHHARTFGVKAGKAAALIFRDRIRELFGEEFGNLPTYLSRPAVDDHPQNHSWDGVVNGIVDGFRDVLLSWIDNEPASATTFVENMAGDINEMVRRIAIYILDKRWTVLKGLYSRILCVQLFDSRNIHELYNLLKERFVEFSDLEKAATLDAIRKLPLPVDHDEPGGLLRYTQRNWLSAIAGKGYEPVDSWFKELEAEQGLGKLSEHPDFHSYMESWSGPGPSPYSTQELLAFAENGSLIERLNDFQQSDTWRGPSTEALVNALEETVGINPRIFLRLLPAFLDAKRPFQYGLINGFKRLWDTSKKEPQDTNWNFIWPKLMSFFGELLGNSQFWTEEVAHNQTLTPTRDWIPPIIADFLRAGTKDDDKAYPSELLPSAFSLIKLLLENLAALNDAKEDAMFQAINSSKGKTIEALFSHTLRVCRMSDKSDGNHTQAWESIRPAFDAELAQCRNANYEFSTLAAAYIANLDYISRSWLEANISKIFPQDVLTNFVCAIDGLAYAPATRSIYALLLEHTVIERALRLELLWRQTRQRMIERIALAYLWGDERLNSPRYLYLFESGRTEELYHVSRFFYSVREQELSEEQVERILCFWEECVVWAKTLSTPPKSLFSELSRLICYVTILTDRIVSLLVAVAPYIKVEHNASALIEELDRFVEQDPAKVSMVLGRVLDVYKPDYDHHDRLKKMLIKLAKNGRQEDVLLYVDRIRRLPGMDQLYKQLIEEAK